MYGMGAALDGCGCGCVIRSRPSGPRTRTGGKEHPSSGAPTILIGEAMLLRHF